MSHITRMGPEQILEIFSFFTLQELCALRLVCKRWDGLHSHDRFWKPVLNELKPLAKRVSQKEGDWTYASSKRLVQGLLMSHRVMANAVSRMIVKEEDLKNVLNAPTFSLKQFKAMPFLSRSLEVWKRLGIDSTGLLKSLVDQVQRVALKNDCILGRFFIDEAGKVHDSESMNIKKHICTVMLLDFTKAPISRFSGAEVIKHLQSVVTNRVPAFSEVVNEASKYVFDSHMKFPSLLAEPGS